LEQSYTDFSVHLSRNWFANVGLSCKDHILAERLVSATIGVYLCDALDGVKAHPLSLKIASYLSEYIQHRATIDSSNTTTKLLLAICILSEYDVAVTHMRQFAIQRAAILSNLKIISPNEYAQALLLCRMGFLSFPRLMKLKITQNRRDPIYWLLANEEELQLLCDWLGAGSQYGKQPICAAPGNLEGLARIMPVLILQRLRFYNLTLGANLLRSLTYLNTIGQEVTRWPLKFLEAQQRNDGSFGFFAFDEGYSENQNKNRNNTDIYLSTTLNCLWTIAEMRISRFRLFWGHL
jgi:hypothetical protein